MDWTAIIGFVITAIFGLVARYLVPWLKAKLGAERLADAVYWVEVFVRGVEQWHKDMKGPDKLNWVLLQLSSKGIEMDGNELRALIEAAVLEMRREVLTPDSVTVELVGTAEIEETQRVSVPTLIPHTGFPPYVGGRCALSDGRVVIITGVGLTKPDASGTSELQPDGTYISYCPAEVG